MEDFKVTLIQRRILACPICGAHDGACTPEPHKQGVALMTEKRADDLAMRYGGRSVTDFKSRAAGE